MLASSDSRRRSRPCAAWCRTGTPRGPCRKASRSIRPHPEIRSRQRPTPAIPSIRPGTDHPPLGVASLPRREFPTAAPRYPRRPNSCVDHGSLARAAAQSSYKKRSSTPDHHPQARGRRRTRPVQASARPRRNGKSPLKVLYLARAISARENAESAELGVATEPEWRRPGFATAVSNAWARYQMDGGRIAFHSHTLDHLTSQTLARRLALRRFCEVAALD